MTRTVEEFKLRFRGRKTNDVAKAVTRLTPGIVYTGCSKTQMSDAWAKRDYGIAKLTLDQIEEELEKVEREMQSWRKKS